MLPLAVLSLFNLLTAVLADTPLPPLQWLNLSNLLQGSAQPPPLKNALIGYDETSRSVIIFGGESATGLVQSQTYLLNLDTLTWSVPSPPPSLQRTPPARTSAVGGADFAASNRHGFLVIGGRGADGKPLSDVWEYDFLHQFWSQVNVSPGGPSPRWGASGGIDTSTPPVQDVIVPGPNNTFYLTGGYDGSRLSSLSDVWRFHVSGTLSPNLPDDANGSWERISAGNTTPRLNQSGTVVSNRIVVTGGCNTTASPNDCPQQLSYIIDSQLRTQVSPSLCPAPRTGPVLAPNLNRFTSTYSSQVFLLLGNLNKTVWDDGGALAKGEVAVLDVDTGSWSRVLPAGDPGTSNKPQSPTPREGASAISFHQALVGQSRPAAADTLVFGGQDASGRLLSELWLLRAYNSSVTPSNPNWPGFGDGQLQTGVNANGAGVRMTYLSNCASLLQQGSQHTNGSTPPPPGPTNSSPHHDIYGFDTSTTHKILAPVSLALLQITFLFFRLSSPLYGATNYLRYHTFYTYTAAFFALPAYGLGAAGLATSFASISATDSIKSLHLQTGHGIAGIVIFVLLYGLLPLLLLASTRRKPSSHTPVETKSERGNSIDAVEKLSSDPFEGPTRSTRSPPQSIHNISPPSSPRRRADSWGPSGIMPKSQEGSDTESIRSTTAVTAPTPHRTFEVVNRAGRGRKASGLSYPPFDAPPDELAMKDLQHIDWLQRRRSLNAVGELDYAITQARRELLMSTPATTDPLMSSTAEKFTPPPLPFPPLSVTIVHLMAQIFLLLGSVLTLFALWKREHGAAFAVFLAWVVVFYAIMLAIAFRLRTDGSILYILYRRVSSRPREAPSLASASTPPQVLPPDPSPGPYVHHQPPYHRAVSSPIEGSYSHHGGPLSVEASDDDDIDEDTRQRMIEEEMGRRDVSIVTVPKRKLWVTNPS